MEDFKIKKPKVLVILSSGRFLEAPIPCFFDHPHIKTLLLTPLAKIPENMPKKRIGNYENIIVPALRAPRLFLLSYMVLGAFSVARIIRKERISIIHSHGPIAFFVAFVGSRIAHKRVLIDFHYFEPSPGLLEVHQGKWRRNDFRLKISELVTKIAIKWSDFIITSTSRLKESLVERGKAKKHVGIIPNSMDTDEIIPLDPDDDLRKNLGLCSDEKVVMFVGTFHGISGADVLIKAASLVNNQKIRFVMVGGGPEGSKLQKMCRKLGLTSRIIFPGIVPFSRISSYLSIADLCVAPAMGGYWNETGFVPGKTILYMAAGKATLLFSSDKAKKLEAAGTCLTVAFHSAKAYARAIENALSDPSRLQRIGQAARQNVEQNRDWKKNQAKYLKIYRSILNIGD